MAAIRHVLKFYHWLDNRTEVPLSATEVPLVSMYTLLTITVACQPIHLQLSLLSTHSPQCPEDAGGAEAMAARCLHRLSLSKETDGTLQPLVKGRVKLGVIALHV